MLAVGIVGETLDAELRCADEGHGERGGKGKEGQPIRRIQALLATGDQTGKGLAPGSGEMRPVALRVGSGWRAGA